jgi:hypothetical protein
VGVCAHPGAAAGLAYKTAGGRGGVAPRRAVTWTAVSRGVVPREPMRARQKCLRCAVIGGVGVWLGSGVGKPYLVFYGVVCAAIRGFVQGKRNVAANTSSAWEWE